MAVWLAAGEQACRRWTAVVATAGLFPAAAAAAAVIVVEHDDDGGDDDDNGTDDDDDDDDDDGGGVLLFTSALRPPRALAQYADGSTKRWTLLFEVEERTGYCLCIVH